MNDRTNLRLESTNSDALEARDYSYDGCPDHPEHNGINPQSNIGSSQRLAPWVIKAVLESLGVETRAKAGSLGWWVIRMASKPSSHMFVSRCSPEELHAQLNTEMAEEFASLKLVDALCNESCSRCGDFGPILHIFTCRRFCIDCFYLSILERHLPLDNGRHDHLAEPEIVSESKIGSLQCLPPEIIENILEFVDLQTLTDVRRVCWRARTLVNNLPSYKLVARCAPEVLRVLLGAQWASLHTSLELTDALCEESCALCGKFGPILNIFNCRRFCLDCVYMKDVGPSIPTVLQAASDSTKTALHNFLPLLSLPAIYSFTDGHSRRRIRLDSLETPPMPFNHLTPPLAVNDPFRMFVRPMWCYDRFTEGLDPMFQGLLRVPTVNRKTGVARCVACCDSAARTNELRRYEEAGFFHHSRECQLSKLPPKEPEPSAGF